MRGGLTGSQVAQAFVTGPMTILRLQKAAQHLQHDEQKREFWTALPVYLRQQIDELDPKGLYLPRG